MSLAVPLRDRGGTGSLLRIGFATFGLALLALLFLREAAGADEPSDCIGLVVVRGLKAGAMLTGSEQETSSVELDTMVCGPDLASGIERFLARLVRSGEGNRYAVLLGGRTGVRKDGVRRDIVYALLQGPVLLADSLRILGARHSSVATLLRKAKWKSGTPVTAEMLDALRRRLLASGLLDSVGVPVVEAPCPGLGAGVPGSTRCTVLLRVVERPIGRFEGALGFSEAAGGLTGAFSLELINPFGSGRRVAAGWWRSGEQEGFEIRWREPRVVLPVVALEAELTQERNGTLYAWTSFGLHAYLGEEPGPWLGVGVRWKSLVSGGASGKAWREVVWSAGAGARPRRLWLRSTGWIRCKLEDQQGEGGLWALRGEGGLWLRTGSFAGLAEFSGALIGTGAGVPVTAARRLGGTTSLRGLESGALAAGKYLCFQSSVGALAGDHLWAYAYVDVARLQPLCFYATAMGVEGPWAWKTSVGCGFRLRRKAGFLRVEYGLQWGESLSSGCLQIGLGETL